MLPLTAVTSSIYDNPKMFFGRISAGSHVKTSGRRKEMEFAFEADWNVSTRLMR